MLGRFPQDGLPWSIGAHRLAGALGVGSSISAVADLTRPLETFSRATSFSVLWMSMCTYRYGWQEVHHTPLREYEHYNTDCITAVVLVFICLLITSKKDVTFVRATRGSQCGALRLHSFFARDTRTDRIRWRACVVFCRYSSSQYYSQGILLYLGFLWCLVLSPRVCFLYTV